MKKIGILLEKRKLGEEELEILTEKYPTPPYEVEYVGYKNKLKIFQTYEEIVIPSSISEDEFIFFADFLRWLISWDACNLQKIRILSKKKHQIGIGIAGGRGTNWLTIECK